MGELSIRGFAKLKKFQKSKNNLEVGGWVEVQIWIKKIGKSSKNKVLRLYNSPLLGGARGTSRCACMQHFIPYSVIVLRFG